MQGMSERQYAAHVGLSRGAIQKAKAAERLVLYPDGSINAVANVIAPLQRRLVDNLESDEAPALQEAVNRMRPVFKDVAPIPALKQIVAHLRQDPSWVTVRPPFVELNDAQAQSVLAALAQSGLVEQQAA